MSGPPGVEKPTVADEVVQQVKNSSPPAAGADGEEGKMVFRRPGKSRRKTRRIRAGIFGNAVDGNKIASLADTPPDSREEIFRQKLEFCCTTFDYFDTDHYLEEKSLKLRQLEELIVYTRPDSDISFSEETIKCVMKMIRVNLFRPPDLPLTPEEEVFGIADEDENILELIWQNIQPVYQLFLNIVVHKNLDTNQAKRQITLDFIGKFAELFDRDDAREREYVKTLLHRMYGRFLSFRSSIRRLMAHKFFEVVYENRCNRGVAEMLEFLGSIINGFATPLKAEHVRFLEAALIPLLKSPLLPAFLLELMYCLTQFVEKDPNTSVAVMRGLRRYWPVMNTAKQLMYLQMVEEVLNIVVESEGDVLRLLYDPLSDILRWGFACPAFAVLERTCELWASEYLCEKLFLHRDIAFTELLPRIYRALLSANKSAWSPPAEFLTKKVLTMYQDLDGAQLAAMEQADLEKQSTDLVSREQASQMWANILQAHEALPLAQQVRADEEQPHVASSST